MKEGKVRRPRQRVPVWQPAAARMGRYKVRFPCVDRASRAVPACRKPPKRRPATEAFAAVNRYFGGNLRNLLPDYPFNARFIASVLAFSTDCAAGNGLRRVVRMRQRRPTKRVPAAASPSADTTSGGASAAPKAAHQAHARQARTGHCARLLPACAASTAA